MKYPKSIVTDDMQHCLVCKTTSSIEIHHVFFGANRKKSTVYGLVVPLCYEHHRGTNGVHGKNGHELDLKLKRISQKKWENKHGSRERFIKYFGRNYLYDEDL